MRSNIKDIEAKINELASKVIPKENLQSFYELPLKEKVFGVKFIATIAKESEVVKMCEHIENVYI